MKIKIITPEDYKRNAPKLALVSLSRHSGRMGFNSQAIELLALTQGCKVAIIQDQDSLSDWYIATHYKGFPVGVNGKTLAAFNKYAVNDLLDSMNLNQNTVQIPISAQPVVEDGIILHCLLYKAAKDGRKKQVNARQRESL